jgi:hypothetical protein
VGCSGIAEEGGGKGSRRRPKVEVGREEERVAVAGRCIYGLLSKVILLVLVVLCLLLASLPSIPPSVALWGEVVQSVVFHEVRPHGRGGGGGGEVAALGRGLAVPQGEEEGTGGRDGAREEGRAGEGWSGSVVAAGPDEGRINLEREEGVRGGEEGKGG